MLPIVTLLNLWTLLPLSFSVQLEYPQPRTTEEEEGLLSDEPCPFAFAFNSPDIPPTTKLLNSSIAELAALCFLKLYLCYLHNIGSIYH